MEVSLRDDFDKCMPYYKSVRNADSFIFNYSLLFINCKNGGFSWQ